MTIINLLILTYNNIAMYSINCSGRILDLNHPVIMGIINVTPDSFYDGGEYNSVEKSLIRAGEMIKAGAQILDVGGMSSRPGADIIKVDEEINRTCPVIQAIRSRYGDIFISIDTFRKDVAKAAIESGADIINDISAGDLDPGIIDYAGEEQIPYILMHMKGIPANMQEDPIYSNVVQQVLHYLIEKVKYCQIKGIRDLIIDPGFGFGKSLEHNYELLKALEVFQLTERPILVGISRKSMIYKALEGTPDNVLYGTTAAHMVALQKGAKILRVHDVEAARQTLAIWERIQQ